MKIGKGELWQGGTIVSTEVETDGDPDQETINTEDVNDTGNDTSDTPTQEQIAFRCRRIISDNPHILNINVKKYV